MPRGTRGPDNPFWTGGRKIDKQGYVLIWLAADHPMHCMANKANYVREHRLVMAEWLGRPLTKEEVVHHVNGIVDDNRIENLDLLPHASSHIKLHAELRRPTHCPAGHAYTEENTYEAPSGYRACKTCLKAHEAKRTAKRSAERAARRAARGWKAWPFPPKPPFAADDEDDEAPDE